MDIHRISWLTAIIEGEGSICLNSGGKGKKFFNTTISITNTDKLILDECKKIIDDISGGNAKLRHCDSTGRNRPCFHLVVEGKVVMKKLIETIIPYIIGEKKAQAEIMLQFINRRLSLKGDKKKAPNYTTEDRKYYDAMCALKAITKPVETTRSSSQVDGDIVRAENISKISELGRNDLTAQVNFQFN